MNPTDQSTTSRETRANDFIARKVSECINRDLLAAAEKLFDYSANRNDIPMYILANARNAILEARKAIQT